MIEGERKRERKREAGDVYSDNNDKIEKTNGKSVVGKYNTRGRNYVVLYRQNTACRITPSSSISVFYLRYNMRICVTFRSMINTVTVVECIYFSCLIVFFSIFTLKL